MSEAPWLTIVGLGEDGADGLSAASRNALDAADVVMGPKRHLDLLAETSAERVVWPVPFADGLPLLEGLRGRQVVVLASGDPFWFGAGSVIASTLGRDEWQAVPGVSTFSMAASRLGWRLEDTTCLGLHAAPFTRLRPHLAPGQRAILLVRDGEAVADLATYLSAEGFGPSKLAVLERLGSVHEFITEAQAAALPARTFAHPVAVAVEFAGAGAVVPSVSGLDDAFFETDGQITKRPARALALSALAPRPGERLWDIGGGSGSIAIEWLLAHSTTAAISIEPNSARVQRIRTNAARLGADRLEVVEGRAPEVLGELEAPDAVFVGGGLSEPLLDVLFARLARGTRLVAHAVTLQSEALLTAWSQTYGGTLLRVELAQAAPLGSRLGWKSAYPVVQWQVTL